MLLESEEMRKRNVLRVLEVGVPISEKSTSFEKKDINFCTSSDVNASARALARFSTSVFTSSLPMLVCWIRGVGGNEGGGRRAIERSGNVWLGGYMLI